MQISLLSCGQCSATVVLKMISSFPTHGGPNKEQGIVFWQTWTQEGLFLPNDLNTVVFSGRAGFVPFNTSPSSAKISACEKNTYLYKTIIPIHTLRGKETLFF